MGDAEEVVLFIRECLNMDTVLEVSAHCCSTIYRMNAVHSNSIFVLCGR